MRAQVLKTISEAMSPGSILIIGVDTFDPKEIDNLLKRYQDPASVNITANPYVRMGLTHGEDFCCRVSWDPDLRSIVSYVDFKSDITLQINDTEPSSPTIIDLPPNLSVFNFESHRFKIQELSALIRGAGLVSREILVGDFSTYGVFIAEKLKPQSHRR